MSPEKSSPARSSAPAIWAAIAAIFIISFLVGFLVLGRNQLGAPALIAGAAMCRAIGLSTEDAQGSSPQPPVQTPTRIAWTPDTLAVIAAGDAKRGATVARNCVACHGEQGISASDQFPSLAGMSAAAIYKQLDDFRTHKRVWGVMGALASSLSETDSADVAAHFALGTGGLKRAAGEGLPGAGHSLRPSDPAIRLVFVGEPARGIPPCAGCHGTELEKLGAPPLQGQHSDYIERQLAAFAQGGRKNDTNEQMRTIAQALKPDEMHAVATYYHGTGSN